MDTMDVRACHTHPSLDLYLSLYPANYSRSESEEVRQALHSGF